MEIKELILSMYNDPTYQKLNAYYSKTTIFNVLGVERSENRQSSFLCWLLNNKSSHGLGDEPMKKLLRLYFKDEDNVDASLLSHIMTGDYNLDIEEITTEKVIGKIIGTKDKSRFDIWVLMRINYEETNQNFVFVVENKVYSSEGLKETQDNKQYQTVKYQEAIGKFMEKNKEKSYYPIMIFLTPDGATANSVKFEKLTYQELLDYVIEPLLNLDMSQETKNLITDYIRNLGKPSEMIDEKKNDNTGYSILATSKKELCALEDFYNKEKNNKLYNAALRVLAEESEEYSEEDASLLIDLWETNKELFKSILYNVVLPKESDENNKKKWLSIFKTKRDNTHYQIDGDGGNYNKGGLIVKLIELYISKFRPSSIEDLQEEFPFRLRGKTNSLSNMIVVGDSKYNSEIKGNDKKQWRWTKLEVDGMKENGSNSSVYVHKEWGMSDSWPNTLDYMEEKVKVKISEM